MTFSNSTKGQALVESLVIGLLMIGLCLFGFGLIMNLMAQNFLVRWANYTARCVAITDDQSGCKDKTRTELGRRFSIRDVTISISRHGYDDLHTRIEAKFMGRKAIVGQYDLRGKEYKRRRP